MEKSKAEDEGDDVERQSTMYCWRSYTDKCKELPRDGVGWEGTLTGGELQKYYSKAQWTGIWSLAINEGKVEQGITTNIYQT